jgi:hypothetical protein
MNHHAEDWVAIFTRDTAGWVALPPMARFVSLELARKLDADGEISVGRRGLPALAGLLHAPWSEIEGAVALLLEEGRLEYDEARRVVRDPQHRARQDAARGDVAPFATGLEVVRTAARRSSAPRALSMTPNAVRKRARRAALAAAAAAQLELPTGPRPAMAATAAATAADGRLATLPAASGPSDPGPIVDVPRSAVAATRPSASLSDLQDHQENRESRPAPRSRAAAVELDPEVIPPSFRELAGKVRPDLSEREGVLCRSWRRFARAHGGRHRSPRAVEGRWESWIERERADASPAGATPPPPPADASTGRLRPPRDTSDRIIREREAWEREAAAPELAAQLAARALAALDVFDRARALEAIVEGAGRAA